MEKNEHDKIIAFDTLYTNNHIQMMKIVMPYFDEPMRGKLAVYIKYLEFQHTLERYRSISGDGENSDPNQNNGMMEMLMGMLSPEQQSMFEMFGGNIPHEPE